MSVDLSSWLQALGLDQYGAVFSDIGVDLNALRLLTEADLQELGVHVGHRREMLRDVAELNGGEAAAASQASPTRQHEEGRI